MTDIFAPTRRAVLGGALALAAAPAFAQDALEDRGYALGDVVLDRTATTWDPAPPDPEADRRFPLVVAADDRIVVWGGDACGRDAACDALVPPDGMLVWVAVG